MGITATDFYALESSELNGHIETEFFGALKMSNGTFKLTRDDRFSEIEKSLASFFTKRAGSLKTALDIGVSSGVTTIQFANSLNSAETQIKWTATDLFATAHLVDITPWLRVLADPDGWPLQYDINGRAVRPWIRRLDYLTFAVIPRIMARWYLRPRTKLLIEAGQTEAVKLISPRLRDRQDIEFIEDDIFKRNPMFVRKFDLVRAANILNLNYFSVDALSHAICNLHSYLSGTGALLLVTRTNLSGENAGTLFELSADRSFRVVERIGPGSEVENLVLASSPQ